MENQPPNILAEISDVDWENNTSTYLSYGIGYAMAHWSARNLLSKLHRFAPSSISYSLKPLIMRLETVRKHLGRLLFAAWNRFLQPIEYIKETGVEEYSQTHGSRAGIAQRG
jgi:hypothetical protein